MKVFFDSSAFVKRYIEESGSEAVSRLCEEATDLGLSVIAMLEILGAFNRALRNGRILRPDYARAKRSLAEEIRDATIIQLTPAVIATCTAVLESSPVRAMDAIHVACAMEWGAELFVSSDRRQLDAAQEAGLFTELV